MSLTVRAFALGLVVALLLPAAATAAPPAHSNGNRTQVGELTQDCEGGTITYAGPTEIWPPNHKLLDATLTFTPDGDEEYMYEAMAGHDQVLEDGTEWNGSGNTDPETDIVFVDGEGGQSQMIMGMATGELVVDMLVRAERSGQGRDGRTYTIAGMVPTWSAMDDGCMFSFDITVPHDQRGSNGRDADADVRGVLLTL